ncbi:MAG: hypothetical protein Q7N50_02195 [Armatimonadota bacterium]|nr:hypothetical protein [Armatimonadota bacterium]
MASAILIARDMSSRAKQNMGFQIPRILMRASLQITPDQFDLLDSLDSFWAFFPKPRRANDLDLHYLLC